MSADGSGAAFRALLCCAADYLRLQLFAPSPVSIVVAWFKHLMWVRARRCTWCLSVSLIKATPRSRGFGALHLVVVVVVVVLLWRQRKLARWEISAVSQNITNPKRHEKRRRNTKETSVCGWDNKDFMQPIPFWKGMANKSVYHKYIPVLLQRLWIHNAACFQSTNHKCCKNSAQF